MSKQVFAAALAGALLTGGTGCTTVEQPHSRQNVSEDRNEPGLGISSKDLTQISRDLAEALLSAPAIARADKAPKVAFVSVRNNSTDYIDTNMFLRRMQSLVLTHAAGRIVFLERDIQGSLQTESENQRAGKSSGDRTRKASGADYILTGTIDSIDRASGVNRSAYFLCTFRLIEPDTEAIVWSSPPFEFKKATKVPKYDR
jgi:PBP1b-binding outer membrane lipoprotein LpoB